MNNRIKSRQTLLNAEERGDIPKASRVSRGKVQIRNWTINQLPQIGEKFGFLRKPNKQKIICTYTPKGGVLKSSTTWTFARILALHGIKVLLIGLDIQCSITDVAFPPKQIDELDQYSPDEDDFLGLYHLLYEKVPLKNIIRKTVLPNFDIIPETHELNILEKKLRMEVRSEYFFKERLIPQLSNYDVILFDNSPNWNQLIENSLAAANVIFSPIGCDFLSYRAADKNLNIIVEFGKAAKLKWDNFFVIPTLLERNKLSQQIYGAYLNDYGEIIVPIPIRRAVKGQESMLLGNSSLEHDPKSSLAQDYFELIQYLWDKVIEKDSE
jgi:chromosome partitioning protein